MAAKPRTGSKKTLNSANLVALGVDRLAELLLSLAEDEPSLKRRLRMELATEIGAEDLAIEIEKRLTTIETGRSLIHWRKFKAFHRDFELLRRMIAVQLANLDPAIALRVMWRLLGMANQLLDRANDPRGQMRLALERAVLDAAGLLARVETDPQATAATIVGLLEKDDHEIFHDLTAATAPFLDPLSLRALRHMLEGRLQAKRRPAQTLVHALRQVLDALGDVDGYIATLDPAQLREPGVGAAIGGRLLKAGRVEDALSALARSAPPLTGLRLVVGAYDWETVYIAALEQDGQAELAQSVRWTAFETRLSAERLREHLRRLPDFDEFDAEFRAIAHARTFPDFGQALRFFTDWKSPANAAELVLRRRQDIHPREHDLLVAAAAMLETRHPLAATLLLRAMVVDTLRWGKAERFAEARRQMAELEALAAQIVDWQEAESAAAFAKRTARA